MWYAIAAVLMWVGIARLTVASGEYFRSLMDSEIGAWVGVLLVAFGGLIFINPILNLTDKGMSWFVSVADPQGRWYRKRP